MAKITITIDTNSGKASVKTPVKKARAVSRARAIADKSKSAADLELRLMVQDELDDEKAHTLNVDVMDWVDREIKAGNKIGVTKFLNDNKHRFNPELKDLLIGVIKGGV